MSSCINFSVLIPVYNVEKYLELSINSVLHQTYRNFEMILVDDGSTDNSWQICERYARKFPNVIRAVHKENNGQLHARCYAISLAIGDYCVFLDADDRLKVDALETIASTINRYQCDCVIYGFEMLGEDGRVLSIYREKIVECVTDKRKLFRKILFSMWYNSLCRKAVRRGAFRHSMEYYSKWFHIRKGEDFLHSLEVLQNSDYVVFIPDVLYEYVRHSDSVTYSRKLSLDELEYRAAAVDFLQPMGVFTSEDFVEYRERLLYTLAVVITSAYNSDNSYRTIKDFMQSIKSVPYYKTLLAEGWPSSLAGTFVLWQFRHGFEILLWCESRMYYGIKDVSQKMKSLFMHWIKCVGKINT